MMQLPGGRNYVFMRCKMFDNSRPIWILILGCALATFAVNWNAQSVEESSQAVSVPQAVFLKEGLPLDSPELQIGSYRISKYQEALRKFPSFPTCAKDDTISNGVLSISLEVVNSLEELEVCVFWLADSLRDIEQIRISLGNSGFAVQNNITYPAGAMKRRGVIGEGTQVNGALKGEKIPWNLLSFGDLLFRLHNLSVAVLLTPETKPLAAHASMIRK